MSDRGEHEHQQALNRLRRERPRDTWFISGYAADDNGPGGYTRVYTTNRIRHVDVPNDRIRSRHPIPVAAPGGESGIALIVASDVTVRVRRTKPADLLDGPILKRLGQIGHAFLCYTYWSKTPKHDPGCWLDSIESDIDWKPGPS